MGKKIWFSFILLIVPIVFSQNNPYCELESCPDRSHTVCRFQRSGYGPNCFYPVEAGLNVSELEKIVYHHNIYRRPNNDQNRIPGAYLMLWDGELAFIAQRWANQCEDIVDDCRNVARFNVTQRISVSVTFAHEGPPNLYTPIQRWFENESLGLLNFGNLSLEGSSTSNMYNRIPWGNANRIGCGVVRTYDLEYHILYLVCNYGYLIQNNN